MKASRERLKRIAQDFLYPGPWTWAQEPIHITLADWEPLAEIMEEMIVEKAVPVVLEIVNLDGSPDAIADFRKLWSAPEHGLAQFSDEELLRFRDQLRVIWQFAEEYHASEGQKAIDAAVTQPIFNEWFSPKIDDKNAWLVIHNAGKFVPRPHNLRAIAGRIVIHNSRFLARCLAKNCGRFFIGSRRTQILCQSEGCERARNALANKKFRDKARQTIARRVTKRKGKA